MSKTKKVSQLKIRRGDTLSNILNSTGAPQKQIHDVIKSMKPVFDPKYIRPGQKITISTNKDSDEAIFIDSLSLKLDSVHKIITFKSHTNSYTTKEVKSTLLKKTQRFNGRINSNFYESAAILGVSPKTIIEMIQLFSYDIDFQRDIRENDKFELMLDQRITLTGDYSVNGAIDYASITIKGKTHKIYAYKSQMQNTQYFHENGEGVRKALMRTPINGARLSSVFGKRRHPILGYTKMHKGVDFAAPRGTPIMAAGDGIIKKMGYWGNYGKFIKIEHSNGFSTNYAHLSRFANKQKVGSYIKQGQTIGYVGTTGRSTGPHLHYEVMQNGKHINPKTLQSFSSKKITGSELKNFRQHVIKINKKWLETPKQTRLASFKKNE